MDFIHLLQLAKQGAQLLSGFLTPVLAILAALIAVWQYRLASLNWRLALYDKRYPVYLSTMDYISFVIREGEMTHDRLVQFLRESRDKEFLFGTEVHSSLKDLYEKGVDLKTTQTLYAKMREGEQRTKHIDQENEILKWFLNQSDVANNVFRPYLGITRR